MQYVYIQVYIHVNGEWAASGASRAEREKPDGGWGAGGGGGGGPPALCSEAFLIERFRAWATAVK